MSLRTTRVIPNLIPQLEGQTSVMRNGARSNRQRGFLEQMVIAQLRRRVVQMREHGFRDLRRGASFGSSFRTARARFYEVCAKRCASDGVVE